MLHQVLGTRSVCDFRVFKKSGPEKENVAFRSWLGQEGFSLVNGIGVIFREAQGSFCHLRPLSATGANRSLPDAESGGTVI